LWNPIKITKSIHFILTEYGEGSDLEPVEKDSSGEVRINNVLSLYRELNFPFGFIMTLRNRRSKKGRDVLWGRNHNDKDFVDREVIPKLMDFANLKKLDKDTVGYRYYQLVKDFGIQDLYEQRFTEEESRATSFIDEIRTNASRHALLTHDNWHVLSGYHTDPLGEALVQTITAKCFNLKQAHLVGFFGMIKVMRTTKSFLPFRCWLECLKIAKKIDPAFVFYGPLEFLNKNVHALRKQFNFQKPKIYNEYYQKYNLELSNTH